MDLESELAALAWRPGAPPVQRVGGVRVVRLSPGEGVAVVTPAAGPPQRGLNDIWTEDRTLVWVMASAQKERLLRLRQQRSAEPRDAAERWLGELLSAPQLPAALDHGVRCRMLTQQEADLTLVVPPAPPGDGGRCGVADLLVDCECGNLTMVWPAGVHEKVRSFRRRRFL